MNKRFEELSRRSKTVIATGGGLPANEGNLASLKTHSVVICLWSSPEKIWERVRGQGHRPLLNEPDPVAKIHQLLAEREPYYRQADVLVNTELRSLREVAIQVIHQFHMARAASANRTMSVASAGDSLPPSEDRSARDRPPNASGESDASSA